MSKPAPVADATNVQSDISNGTFQSSDEDVPERLLRYEKKIRTWKTSRLVAGRVMRRIGEENLHRERGYARIEDYAEEHFGIRETRWYQLVRYADTYDLIDERLDDEKPRPEVEAHARPLYSYRKDPELLCRLWTAVLDRLDNLTQEAIQTVVDSLTGNEAEDPERGDEADPDSRFSHRYRRFETLLKELTVPEAQAVLGVAHDLAGSGDLDGSHVKRARHTFDRVKEQGLGGQQEEPDPYSLAKAPEALTRLHALLRRPGFPPSNPVLVPAETEPDEDSSSEESRLVKARRELAPLLHGLKDGVSRSLLKIAEMVAEEEPSLEEDLRVARASFESLSHREAPASGESDLPACFTGSLDTIGERDILIAVPNEMITTKMARKSVPVGVPQAQYEMGVPLSYFDGRPPVDEIRAFYEEQGRFFQFNETNENVDWAGFTTNPICGCLHDCAYCYAWYQAEGMERYKQGFQPTFFPGRLNAFAQMSAPGEINHPREKNVFVGSMSDVFGKWVPDWMIEMILDEAEENDSFDYLFLTKFPHKLSRFEFPDNAWIGTTVDRTHRVSVAERHFKQVEAPVKWLSCEPLLENVAPQFDDLSMFDCVVIGAKKGYGDDIEEEQPDLEWVIDLYQKARTAGCRVYFKENLDLDYPKELPDG